MKKLILSLGLITMLINVFGQTPTNINMQTGGIETCANLNFFDSGGANANYEAGENLIYTFCPDSERAFRLIYNSVVLAEGDSLFIYDGQNANAPLIFVFTSENSFTQPEDFQEVVQISDNNIIGCVTFEFRSSLLSDTEVGWNIQAFCQVRCQSIQANFTGAPGFTIKEDIYIDVCPNESITLTAEGIYEQNNTFYNQSDAQSNFVWSFNKNNVITTIIGQTPTFSFEEEGGVIVGLKIIDQFGCESTNAIEKRIRISPKPNFSGTFIEDEELCLTDQTFAKGGLLNENGEPVNPGEALDLTHETEPLTLGIAGETFLPDGNGVSYETSLFFDQFSPGQVLENAEQLLSICINIEHSYLGDLEMKIECPNGQEAVLKTFPGGGGTYLGNPWDGGDNVNGAGEGLDYCFTNDAAVLLVNAPTQAATLTQGQTKVPGDYMPVDSFENLEGCPLNGAWTIVITDNLGADDGYIFSWGLTFAQEVLPVPFLFTVEQVDRGWLPHNINQPDVIEYDDFLETMTVQPVNTGINNYTYRYINNYGRNNCVFDTVVSVLIKEPVLASLPENKTICANESTELSVNVENQNGNATINWLNQAGNIIASGQTITVSPQDTTWYYLNINDNCPLDIRDSVAVFVNPLPNTSFTADTTQGCTPFVPIFTNTTDNNLTETAIWRFGSTEVISTNEEISHLFRQPGTYGVRLTVTSDKGCVKVENKPNYITVHGLPSAAFTYNPDEPSTINPQVVFTNNSLDYTSSLWNLGTLGQFDSDSLVFTFPSEDEGLYPVTLVVSNDFNCLDSATAFIKLSSVFTLYVPNSFSPNGDNKNDFFYILGNDIDPNRFLLQIYDRSGRIMFETTDINQSWDGVGNNGKEAPVGVYVYKIRAYQEGGAFAEERNGWLNLIR